LSNVYIANLKYEVTEKEIRELFSDFGEIESIKLFAERGYCFINFEKEKDAKEALSLNGTMFLGRDLKVDEARPQRQNHSDRYKS